MFTKDKFLDERECCYCHKKFKLSIFKKVKDNCNDKQCVTFKVNNRSIITNEIFDWIQLNNLYQNNVEKVGDEKSFLMCKEKTISKKLLSMIFRQRKVFSNYKKIKCPINNTIIPLHPKSNNLKLYCKRIGIDYKKYLTEYFPTTIYKCERCNKICNINFNFIDNFKHSKYCSSRCYGDFLLENPQEFSIETRRKLSESLKKKILDGTFKPNITNRFTHFDAKVIKNNKEYKFRSSWEASFFLCQDLSYSDYECLRIPYFENGKQRTYIADFYNSDNNILYEIKPTVFYIKEKSKISQAINFCLGNNIKFIWINENNIKNYIKKSCFDDGKNDTILKQMIKQKLLS